MPHDWFERDPALILCEQCHNKAGTEPHDCTNQAQWHDRERIVCNCCLDCQEYSRQAKAMPM